jgi:hypothetical protein
MVEIVSAKENKINKRVKKSRSRELLRLSKENNKQNGCWPRDRVDQKRWRSGVRPVG